MTLLRAPLSDSYGIHMTIARTLEPVLSEVLGADRNWRITFWDGSVAGAPTAPVSVVVRRRRALRRLLWQPSALGLARGYVAGDLDVEGSLLDALDAAGDLAPQLPEDRRRRLDLLGRVLLGTARVGALGPRPKPPEIEARLAGRRHSPDRDAAAIRHHYDLGNDFYRLLLGESMTYSCGYWRDSSELTAAQEAKCELVARKLGLRRGMRVLDVGCGWGTFAIYAARTYGAQVVGITLSEEQVSYGKERAAEAGVAEQVDIRCQDYREITDPPFDAIASIGMAEHVGAAQLAGYARALGRVLAPGGRILNHAIGRPRDQHRATSAFIDRYVFPDGELVPLSDMLRAFEEAELEIRDVEALRDHYGPTLRAWVANLLADWSRACELIGTQRARAWLLYLSGSALAFERGQLGVNQVLAIKPHPDGRSGMPRTRGTLVLS